jgi:hypothetical protein
MFAGKAALPLYVVVATLCTEDTIDFNPPTVKYGAAPGTLETSATDGVLVVIEGGLLAPVYWPAWLFTTVVKLASAGAPNAPNAGNAVGSAV